MKSFLTLSLVTLTLASPLVREAHAGDPGWGESYARGCSNCADSKFQTPRLNQIMPRHFEDRKRYNAAPCCGEPVRTDPYLIKTVVVSKRRLPHYTYDANGNRFCQRVLTTTYKEIYSDGSCYVWTEQG